MMKLDVGRQAKNVPDKVKVNDLVNVLLKDSLNGRHHLAAHGDQISNSLFNHCFPSYSASRVPPVPQSLPLAGCKSYKA